MYLQNIKKYGNNTKWSKDTHNKLTRAIKKIVYLCSMKWNEPSRGLGDTIEKVTTATGIKKVVDKISQATGTDCGCTKKKDSLNRVFPYKKNL